MTLKFYLNALSICCFETRKIRRLLDRYNMSFAKCTLNFKCDTNELEQKLVNSCFEKNSGGNLFTKLYIIGN